MSKKIKILDLNANQLEIVLRFQRGMPFQIWTITSQVMAKTKLNSGTKIQI